MNDLQTGHQHAHTNAVFIAHPERGMLKFTGETRVDLLHRMSTQNLLPLTSGAGAATVLTTEIGRIIDRLILYTSSDTAYTLTSDNNADTIARYLMRFVFFNDDFDIEDLSAETIVFGVYGKNAQAQLTQKFPETDLPLHHWRQAEIDGRTLYLHRTDPIAGDGYFVIGSRDDQAAIAELLSGCGIMSIEPAVYNYLRIESGQPQFGRELSGDYIPLEANLWDDVSFNKGCYVGQEIIARMESRGQLAKKLMRLQADGPLDTTAALMSNGKTAGTITSIANADAPLPSLALAYLKTKVIDAGTPLMIGETTVEVHDLRAK